MSAVGFFWLTLLVLLVSSLSALFLKSRDRLVRLTGTGLVSLSSLLLIFLAIQVLWSRGNPVELEIQFLWLHIPVLIDGLSSLFLMLLAVLTLSTTVFYSGFNKGFPTVPVWKFYSVFPWFITGLIGLLTVDDLGPGFTMAWQLMVWSSYLLVRWGRPVRLSARPALVYLIFMEAAWFLIAGAAFLIPGYEFGDSLKHLGEKLDYSGSLPALLFFIALFLGFGIKTGIFPLGQFWIPGAYSTAQPPVSALLAGILEKTGVFGLIRIFFFVAREAATNFNPSLWGHVLVVFGTLTLFVGTVQAIKQSDYLKLLAYSSIGQVGYIVMALGSSLLASEQGLASSRVLAAVIFLGALYHSLNHGVFKSLLYLVGGSLLYTTGTRDLNRLGGLLAFMPLTGIIAALASYSIAGMPASSGFVSKWLMIAGNFLAGKNSLLLTFSGIIALFTAAFTLACYVKFFGLAFTSAGADFKLKRKFEEVPISMLLPKMLLTIILLSQALLPFLYLRLFFHSLILSEGFFLSEIFHGTEPKGLEIYPAGLKIIDNGRLLAAAGPIIILVLILVLVFLARVLRQAAGSREISGPVWLGGYQDLNPDNVYVDRQLFLDLKRFFFWTGANRNQVVDDEGIDISYNCYGNKGN